MAEQKFSSFGVCGEFFSAAHNLGYYRSVAVTGVYSSILPRHDLQGRLDLSIQATIREHPALCYGISDHTTNDSSSLFATLKEFHYGDAIEIVENVNNDISQAKLDAVLCQQLESTHTSYWNAGKPAWKVIIIYYPVENSGHPPVQQSYSETFAESRFDIVFAFHHSIADGLSGLSFHDSIMKHFSELSSRPLKAKWPLVVDWDVSLPNLVEEHVDLTHSTQMDSTESTNESDCPIWPGDTISPQVENSYRSRVHMANISHEALRSCLTYCKSEGITLTGYIHGLVCVFLSRGAVKESHGIRAVTPYSLRQFTNTDAQQIVFHAASMAMSVPRPRLAAIRMTQPQSLEEREQIVNIAREFSQTMTKQLATSAYKDELSSLPKPSELQKYSLSILGKQRSKSYEISNLGIGKNPVANPDNKSMTLRRLLMTQSGSITGHAFSVNCATVRGGPLMLAITWSNGVVEDELIESLASYLKMSMERIPNNE